MSPACASADWKGPPPKRVREERTGMPGDRLVDMGSHGFAGLYDSAAHPFRHLGLESLDTVQTT
eukprot:6181189-Pleurochrysis_carterae.AAC.2